MDTYHVSIVSPKSFEFLDHLQTVNMIHILSHVHFELEIQGFQYHFKDGDSHFSLNEVCPIQAIQAVSPYNP